MYVAVQMRGTQLVMRTIRTIAGSVAVLCVIATATGAQKTADAPDQLQVGDRIALTVEGPAAFSDTVIVREGGVILLPNIGEISIQGVRRSEVQSFLSQEIAKYIKNPVVHATALVRIAVVGAVARPGFYSVPSDFVISDVLMEAGGPIASADVNRSTIQRGTKELIGKKGVSRALAAGTTLSELRLASGDQIVVAERPRGNLDNMLRVSGVLVGLAGVAVALSR
jgi:protein involved in polysaccharide export with SLBB domain